MAAIGESAAQELITRAAQVGITAENIADALRMRVDSLHVMSGRDRSRIEEMIAAAAERIELLDRVEFLAVQMGHDGAQRRAQADQKFARPRDIAVFIAQCEKFCLSKGIDIRSDAEKAVARTAAASPSQVNYIVKLLARRASTGEGGGFASTQGLYTSEGNVDRAAVARLSRRAASNLIDSLTGNY